MKSVNSDVDELPGDLPVIQTYNKVKKVFPAEGVIATVVMEVDDVTAGGPTTGIAALMNRVDASPKLFKPGTELIESKDGTVAQINIPTIGSGTDQASLDALNKLRDDIVPATVGAVEGATVNVTGNAAQSADFASNLESRLPLIFAFVFGLAFLLMLVTFRSIVIPITAILLNLLSVGAAYGVLVLVFQNGNGESLIGFTSNGGVANWLPLFLFVVLFGLSMDYHVFILYQGQGARRPRYAHGRGRAEGHHEHGRHRHERRRSHGRCVPRVRHAQLHRLQGARPRPRDGPHPHRRDDHPRCASTCGHEAAQQLELVPAEVARRSADRRRG